MTDVEIASLAKSHIGGPPLTALSASGTQAEQVAYLWFGPARDEFLSLHPWNFAKDRKRLTTSYVSLTGAADSGGLIQLTKSSHGLATGTRIYVKDVGGVDAATGRWYVTSTGANTFTLDDSVFSGTYTSGGSYVVVPQFNWDFRHALSSLTGYLRLTKIGGLDGQADDDGEDYTIENGYILTDNEEPEVSYIYSNTTYTTWPQYAINAFSWLLASYMATNLKADAGEALKLRQAFETTFLPKARAQDARETKAPRTLPFEDSQLVQSRMGVTS